MKKFKKVSALVLAVVLAFSMTACAKKRTAKEVLESSMKKSEKMTSSHMTGSAKYKIESGSSDTASSMDLSMTFDAKVSDSNKDTMKMDMGAKMSVLGQSLDMKMYYTDGYYYMNMAGQKQKMKMDIAAMQKQLKNTTGQSTFPTKYYKDLKLEEKDGNQVLTYKLNEDGLNEYVESVMAQMGSFTGQTDTSSATDSIKISAFSGTTTLDKDDNILSQTIKMTMGSKTGEAGKISITMDMKYKDPGKDVTVSLPDDLSSYQEIASPTTEATTAK